jgi:superfamily II DNA or RNA helicase
LASGRVFLLTDNPRRPEIVFDFPADDEMNEAVKQLPRRWFDWRRKHWRVPADPLIAKDVTVLLERFPELEADMTMRHWLDNSKRWRALVSVGEEDGRGVFLMRTLAGEPPDDVPDDLSFSEETAHALQFLDGVEMDDLARACARELVRGRMPAGAELSFETDSEGEPQFVLITRWDPRPAQDFKRLPEASPLELYGRFFNRASAWGVAVPADAAFAHDFKRFVDEHPDIALDDRSDEVIAELVDEHDRAAATVALSYAEDAELDESDLGGELHPFQRAGVRYALERRRTFIADEQGLGKTVQALAALERDGAFPAIVVCPASMKLMWEREANKWLPKRTVALLEGRTEEGWPEKADEADIVVVNYDILEAHAERLIKRGVQALVLDESHYLKNPGAQRTKAAFRLVEGLDDNTLRLALTGTPILNRADELIAQLRVLGRLKEFGTGAGLSRRFRDPGTDDRLHWNLRASCYVRRTKQQVLPQLPDKQRETIPVMLSNERDYRLAEQDVITWLRSLPLDFKTVESKVAAALRAEQLVRLNELRQLAARGKLPTALAWIEDFLASGEALVVFAEHIEIQKEVLAKFPGALHILGSDSTKARQDAVDAFQRHDGPQLIVCSLKAASQGITLTRASNVAFLELDWTPARHAQAEDRLHRIGQESAVNTWYLLAPDTIDETMSEVLERKKALIGSVTDGQVRDAEPMVAEVIRELKGKPFRHLRVVA